LYIHIDECDVIYFKLKLLTNIQFLTLKEYNENEETLFYVGA